MSAADITLLTFDPVAGMAYLYLAPRGSCAIAGQRGTTFGEPGAIFPATIDRGEDGRSVGAEFPAATRAEALTRAAEIEANIA